MNVDWPRLILDSQSPNCMDRNIRHATRHREAEFFSYLPS